MAFLIKVVEKGQTVLETVASNIDTVNSITRLLLPEHPGQIILVYLGEEKQHDIHEHAIE